MTYSMQNVFHYLILSVLALSLSACPQTSDNPPDADNPSPTHARQQVYFTEPLLDDAESQKNSETVDQVLCKWLDQSQHSLDMAAFELDLPCVQDSLIAAKKRGVKVRLVVDSENPSPELKAIAKAGIPIVGDERGALMHNKFIVRDQKALWTGSLNFTVNGVERNHNNAIYFENTDLARVYQAEFEEMFLEHSFGPKSPQQKLPQLVDLDYQGQKTQAEVFFAPEDPVRQRLIDLLKQAKKSIYFMAFSFTDDELGKILKTQAKARVEVHGLFETTGSGTKFSEFKGLKKQGLDVKTDGSTKVILHHKVFVIDENIVVTGSYNFSKNADRSNDENMLILHNAALAKEYLNEFKRLYTRAQ